MDAPATTAHPSPIARFAHRAGFVDERDFLLRVVQPALVGLIDGTVSSIAPIFAAAISSDSHTAFVVGLATALGAGVSMGWSEALSDTGETTGRGSPVVRGGITGGMTALGGLFHTLPFLISDVHTALVVAGCRRRRRAVRDRVGAQALPGGLAALFAAGGHRGRRDRVGDRHRDRFLLAATGTAPGGVLELVETHFAHCVLAWPIDR